MEQITAFFEGINWDNVMGVVTDYVTKIDIKPFVDGLWELFGNVVGIILGAFGIEISL